MAEETLEVLIKMRGGRAAAAEIKGVTKETSKLSSATGKSAIATDRAARSGRGLRSAWGGLIGVGARLGGALGAAGLGGAAFFAVRAFSEKQRAVAQTAAVLKSTGGQANVTEKQIDRMSTRIARMAGVDDEVVRAGQNMLLTFRDVRNEQGKGNKIFDQTTLAAADLSQAFTAAGKNMTLADASLQIGKALNDPAKGMKRLQRIGVTFTADQEKQVEAMMKAGNTMGAQKVILAELNKEFGGSAKAQGKTLAGMWGRLKFEAGDLAEAVGELAAPVLTRWLKSASKAVPKLLGAFKTGGIKGFIRELDRLLGLGGLLPGIASAVSTGWRIVGGAFGWVRQNASWLIPVAATLLAGLLGYRAVVGVISLITKAQLLLNAAMLLNPIGLVVAGIAALGAILVYAYLKVGWFRRGVQAVWGWLKKNWPLILGILTGPVGLAVVLIVKHWDKIKGAARAVGTFIKDRFNDVVGFFRKLPGRVGSAVSGMFDGIKEAFRSAINWVIEKWNNLGFKIPGFDPPGPGPKFGGVEIGTPNIPLLAEGGVVAQRGAAIVGDRGPELLELPDAARVTPLDRARGAVREVVKFVTVDGKVLAEAVFDEAETAAARS